MNTCEDHDSVVVYTERKCPVCEIVEERDDFEKERDEFEEKVADLEYTIEELNEKVEKLQRQILTHELKKLEGGER